MLLRMLERYGVEMNTRNSFDTTDNEAGGAGLMFGPIRIGLSRQSPSYDFLKGGPTGNFQQEVSREARFHTNFAFNGSRFEVGRAFLIA
jgi:hypothetical protein